MHHIRAVITLGALLVAAPATAQDVAHHVAGATRNTSPDGGLRGRISQLFSFGDCGQPLCLDGSINAANGHGDHFLPATVASNSAIITFVTDAIGVSIANVPLGSTSGGETFSFQGGLPVKTSESAGPIFGERGQTLGRRRILAGANVTGARFRSLRGVPLSDIGLNFTHQDVDPAGLGEPLLENDIIQVRTSLDIDLLVTSFFVTYGVTDRLDVALAVPLVRTSLDGSSFAQVIPFGPGTGDVPRAVHFFGGTPENPILSASAHSHGSATGLGDVAARGKFNLNATERSSFALLADVRLPTGDEKDLLGSGMWSARVLGVLSSRLGAFSPHANIGLHLRGGEQPDAFLATLGFDHMLSSWSTLAFDLLSEWQLGQSALQLPAPVTIQTPFLRTVNPTNIPNVRDDFMNASVGVKLRMNSGVTGVMNLLLPMNDGGVRAASVWTLGLEYSF